MTRAACVPEANPPVDLTEVREYDCGPDSAASPPLVLAQARGLCGGCPVLVKCRQMVLRVTDVAGFAGGMTEVEREVWRHRNGVHVTPASIVDVTPAQAITPAVTDDLPELDGSLPDEVRALVLRMTDAHMTAEDIIAALDHPAVTHRTVKYIRHRYYRGPTRVDA